MDRDEAVLVYVGDEVKALDDNGRIGGYLVRYGSPTDVDLTGDYFDATSDFDVDEWPHKSRVYYQHGMDSRLKNRKLGNGEMRQDDIGVWVEAQLALRDEYEKAIFELVKQGKMGWSSGTAGHLVERENKGTANHIKHWPLGLDASITPTPAEYRNSAVSLKSLAAVDSSYQALLPEAETPPPAPPTPLASPPMGGKQPGEGSERGRPSAVQSEVEEPVTVEIKKSNQQEIEMDEEETTTTPATQDLDIEAMVKAAVSEAIEKLPVKTADIQVPMVNTKTKLGDSETKAFAHWIRSGDDSGIRSLKASNNTDMNIGTAADGGYAVPTGHYQQIIAKLRETALYPSLGVRMIPGKGTVVNVPIEGARDGAFVVTGEAGTTDRDSPVIAQVAMTLLKYTKRLEISWELMEDEDSNLMSFLSDWVGEGMAITHNTLLVTEALANGTLGAAWTAGAPVAADVPELVYALPTGYETGAAWVMRKATEGIIRGLTGTNFQFVPTAPDGPGALSRRELFGFPLYNSQAMPALAASAKVALFGNFRYMGMRLAPDITFIRDPYSAANTGQLRLHYYFRTVYKVLQAEAILYGTQGT